MTQLNNISQSLHRMALCLALMLCASFGAWAQVSSYAGESENKVWDGYSQKKPFGSGTAENPYVIANAENLYWIAHEINSSKAAYFVQTEDIDLGGHEWVPIGLHNVAFTGSYDGQGHTIKGLYVDWGNYKLTKITAKDTYVRNNANQYSYGLFGYFSGTVKNLVIDGANIEQKPQTAASAVNLDKRIGVLVGNVVVSNNITIENIIVRNSEINGCAAETDYQQRPGAYMIGGIVGDIHAGDANTGYNAISDSYTITIRNIYSEVNVNLPYTTLDPGRETNKGYQYYYGGIVGRGRLTTLEHMPKNVIYKGEVNAPVAIVGPVFAFARNASSLATYDGLNYCYAGDLVDNVNGQAKTADYTNINYYDYKIWDYSDAANPPTSATLVDINNLNHNETLGGNDVDTYTFKKQIKNANNITTDAPTLAMYQGVNRGTAITTTDDFKTKAEALATGGYAWDFNGTNRNMSLDKPINLTFVRNDAVTFTAEYETESTKPLAIKWFYRAKSEYRFQELTGSIITTEETASGKKSTMKSLITDDAYYFMVMVYDMSDEAHPVPLESKHIWVNESDVAIKQDDADRHKYNFAINDDTDLSGNSEYTITGWSMFNENLMPIDITHLSPVTTSTEAYIDIDDAFIPRILAVNYTKDDKNDFAFLSIEKSTFGVIGSDFPYMAVINGSTEDLTTNYPDKTFHWEIAYDDGKSQTIAGTTLAITDVKRPTTNAIYTLVIKDAYGEWREAERKLYNNKVVTVSRSDDGKELTAMFDGYVPGEGTWVWRGVSGDVSDDVTNGYTLLSTTNVLGINATNDNYDVYCAVWTSPDGEDVLVGYYSKKNVIYVFNKEQSAGFKNGRFYNMIATYPDGNNNNDGRTPRRAVRDMTTAYKRLADGAKAKDNIIVVMGYVGDTEYLSVNSNFLPKNDFKKNATITGSYGEIDDGVLLLIGGNSNPRGLNGATIFKDITFYGFDHAPNKNKETELIFYCNLNDVTFANGVKIENYSEISANNNGLGDYTAPQITIVGGMHNYDNETPLVYPSSNELEGVTTIDIASGCFGRIIASTRNHYETGAGTVNRYNKKSHNVFGHPDSPHRVRVSVAINHTKDASGNDRLHEYSPGKEYLYDIGLLVGGQTDGSVYVDSKLEMVSGSVGRFISGNISYGRKTWTDGDAVHYPADGFYGSTVLTLYGGEIGELVGGTLGRYDSGYTGTDFCEAYFYGRSILNINGGVVNGNIYGAGAGGVVGIGDNDDEGFHTKDYCIPYYTGATDTHGRKVVSYGDYYAAKGKMPKIKLREADETLELADGKRNVLDLSKSYCEVNVNGGIIKGNIYGGGYGYSKQIVVERALDQAGDLFGRSCVTISGGTILGNVYGGGAGASEYFFHHIAQSYYNSRIDAGRNTTQATQDRTAFINLHKDEWLAGTLTDFVTQADLDYAQNHFHDLANVYGNTNVLINGGVVEGKVFAGSQGISGLPKMATLFGNTSLAINDFVLSDNTVRVPIINNNIYGGSELGRIEGNTNVTISGGAIGNCIFGGSEGIASVRNADGTITRGTTAYITGSTNLNILGGSYFTIDEHNRISEVNRLPISGRTFNIYGGGYNNCIIETNTKVLVKQSLLTSHKNLLEDRSFEDCVNDETYRKFSVYGGGRGEFTDIRGNANLTINIEGGASVPSSRPVDVANRQQFFMIAGGGMAGHVWGNTNVNLDGNIFARRIYGGGMYGNVLGNVNMTVRRGAYYGVFGGGLLGNVKGKDGGEHAINLQIGTRVGETLDDGSEVTAEEAAEANRNLYIYNNVYGGNDVSGCAGYKITDQLWNDGTYDSFIAVANMNSLTDEQKKHHYEFEHWKDLNGGNTYYRHLIKADETKGVNMKICGGTILGDVFGAGNGNHTGYYVPNNAESESHSADDYVNKGIITRMKFYEGLPYHYRVNKKDKNSYVEANPTYNRTENTYTGTLKSVLDEDTRKDYGLYEYRPRVGKVVMHIGGNSESDRVYIGGDVFGGGHACTIGKYDPARDVLTDPLRFEGGGLLKMNFGSHVTVNNSVYMGSRGRIIGQQTIVGTHDYDGITLNSDMDYHYYDYDAGKYLLGFPNTLEGRMRFHAYMKLVNMDATTELTFYDQTDNSEAKDVRWGSFFAGGARGSMTKLIDGTADHPAYEYTLPAGLTIETRAVGGSEDAEITYYDYTSKTGTDAFTEINYDKPIFTFYGGIVYDSHLDGHYGGGRVKWHDVSYDESTDTKKKPADKMVGNESPRGSLTVMKLNVNCQFDPQKIEGKNDNYASVVGINPDEEETFEDYFGGLVYGGCYNSGITNGSVEVTCTNNLLGEHFQSDDYHDYLTWSSLRRNVGRVYGGGYGEHATILGNTTVTLDKNARCFNVFGGGMIGNVTGGTDITIKGLTSVYNAVYGGSLRGNIGQETYTSTTDGDLYAKGTHIRLISGGVDRVYGGGFIGKTYGGTHVLASDEGQPEGTPRLMVGTIYGGNDVSGDVYKDNVTGLCTDIRVNEEPRADKQSYTLAHESETEAGKYYGGFPLIGTIYGAGNGNMSDYINGVYIGRDDHEYSRGLIHIASGNGADYHTLNLGNREGMGTAYQLPDIAEKTRVEINGGTIVNVYGGGSMCTVKGSDEVVVNYADTVARAAVPVDNIDPMTWGVLRLFQDLQQQEVTTTSNDILRFSYQIYRVFGGNNLMDMAIQPKLDLRRGQLFSVYSGGNFGRMTYIRDTDATPAADQPRGLNLTIDSKDISIAAVYGGGRVGDIHPLLRREVTENGKKVVKHIPIEEEGGTFSASEYGATLNIKQGLIGEVYGGNNVAGTVYYGTNVNISGAISGNVYGSGNGNYIYYYDYDNSKADPVVANQISEAYDEAYGGRYFVLPKKVAYTDGTNTTYYGSSAEEKILAINSYRPNVNKTLININGSPESLVYVRGNVFCGGNSSTVFYNSDSESTDKIQLKIGSYATLNGVFLGSNGEGLANPFNITYLANLNDINNMGKPNAIASTPLDEALAADYDKPAFDTALYPNLLSLYMRAAEVTAMPDGFYLPTDTREAYIGNFTLGGNYGSMMTNKTINVVLPECLTIYGRVVGGCYNSRLDFQGATALGGMTKPLMDGYTDKVNLNIYSKFRPWRLYFDEDTHEARLVNDRQRQLADGTFVDVLDADANSTDKYYYTEGRCNIFGGCFTSGKTVGDININLYSDVLGRYITETQPVSRVHTADGLSAHDQSAVFTPSSDRVHTAASAPKRVAADCADVLTDAAGRALQVNKKAMMNNVGLRRTVYGLTGGGYGPLTEVEGNIHVHLLPTANSDGSSHPSIATIFGGAHNGKHIGNSTTEIRDGMVFSSVYGGSRAALKYGSSEVIVGYPKYYVCTQSGTFALDRADKVSYVALANGETANATTGMKTHTVGGKGYNAYNHDMSEVIKHTVKYRVGDIVAANVYKQIVAANAAAASSFEEKMDVPADYDATWDVIGINIGDNSQMNNPDAHFYGGGGIYGGGHAINESAQVYSGVNTQLAYNANNNPEGSTSSTSIGYGGNSTIIVGDDPANLDLDNAAAHDHISIGTGHYVKVKVPADGDKIGTYAVVDGKFVHQSSGTPAAGTQYYKMETDGGIYGDGRRTFVQGFRAVDITGYGYADYAPQSAKLINTFQRMDLLSLNDCCLQLQGAQDYATNTIDATLYSIARVSEIRMNSTLAGNIIKSVADDNNAGNMSLTTPRSRNYMGFFKNVHYIGAMYSNTDFDGAYRGGDGATVAGKSYKSFKKAYIDEYETSAQDAEATLKFKERNLGTSPNMIGINNGYTLKIQNSFTTAAPDGDDNDGDAQTMLSNVPTDNIYYGPIVGVVEVKLLTLAPDEGGGYIYAFNQHEDKTGGGKTFLEETGNFVFAAQVEGSDKKNYIVDDCYPLGYYDNANHAEDEEIHYWYVQGHKYYFNTTLTAYTYNKDIEFYLNNADDLILLSGITPSSDVEIESVTWQEHVENDSQCALTNNLNASGTDSRDNYRLYLTINQETRDKNLNLQKDGDDYTHTGDAFVARIPNGNGNSAWGLNDDNTIAQHNSYRGDSNSPLLGIRLEDTDNENYKPEFFDAHLADPDVVVIKIKSKGDGDENFYTINLTIDYLQGPYLEGQITIENCALPGEYIYANTGRINAVMDNSLTVTGKRWYLYPRVKQDPTKEVYTWSENDKVDVSQYMMDNIAGDVNRLQLPARYYQHDWRLDYVVLVNGQPFTINNKSQEIPRITVHNYHRMSTVARAVKDMTDAAHGVGITNYGYDLDLDLVGGALVYIEDNHDFELFTKYVNYCNGFRSTIADKDKSKDFDYVVAASSATDPTPVVWQIEKANGVETHRARVLRAEVLPGYNRNGYITGYVNDNTILGYADDADVPFRNVKNPSGAENIRFVLNTDVTANANCMAMTEFRGRFNGNGHTITFGSDFAGENFIERNYGTIRDVGFVSTGGDDTNRGEATSVVKYNRGMVENCYYFYYPEGHLGMVEDFSGKNGRIYANLIGVHQKTADVAGAVHHFAGTADNCYQNTNQANADAIKGVRYRSNNSFHNGTVAFNLNQEYLIARYISEDNDALVRERMKTPVYDSATGQYTDGDYLYSYYADGDYRYGNVRSAEHPEGLRLSDNFGVPNYENDLGHGKTMHITNLDIATDESRWFTLAEGNNKVVQLDGRGNVVYDTNTGAPVMTNKGYFPIYLYNALDGGNTNLADHSDFIFFGQRLTTGDDRDYYPVRINRDNRVYRAGGSYGSRTDYGFHFNRDANAMGSMLTAIDFTGTLDLKQADGKPIYKERWQYYLKGNGSGEFVDNTHYEQSDEIGYDDIIARSETDSLIQLVFYPPTLNLPGGDYAKYIYNIESFNIDSNADITDHEHVTKNLLVYTPEIGDGEGQLSEADSERLFGKLHYTRMQRWGDVAGETPQDDLIGHHITWKAHTGSTSLTSHFHAYGGLLHLADAQDFNAPIAFYVAGDDAPDETNGRAWLKRAPKFYASRTGAVAADGSRIGRNGWESIALPFTCNRVVAVNAEDYIEQYSRGQITHFYGSDPERGMTHHDYWLRGLVAASKDNCSPADDIEAEATFARPGKSYKDENGNTVSLFEVNTKKDSNGYASEQMRGDYTYMNNWFERAYPKRITGYTHNEYADTLQFLQYCYLTKNAPYIVAFPGEDYYEFDLSGRFYNRVNEANGCNPQEILYEYSVDEAKRDTHTNYNSDMLNVRIPVTDVYDEVRHTTVANGGYNVTHHATFMRIADDDIKPNMYVLNTEPTSYVNTHGDYITYDPGSVFINCQNFGITEILPFRTYIEVPMPDTGHAPRFVTIGSIASDENGGNDEQEEPEEADKASKLTFAIVNNSLVITSPEDMMLPLYGVSGQLYRTLTVKQGRNVYRNLAPGVYITGGFKFAIRR